VRLASDARGDQRHPLDRARGTRAHVTSAQGHALECLMVTGVCSFGESQHFPDMEEVTGSSPVSPTRSPPDAGRSVTV
jgi:hypothetical protein